MLELLAKIRLLACACLLAAGCAALSARAAEPAPAEIDFARQIRPLFEQHCYECHGAKRQEGGLRLDQRAPALAGGDLGRDIMPGSSGESLLLAAIAGTTEQVARMPAKREPLSAEAIALVKQWIDAGAPWPEERPLAAIRASIGRSNRPSAPPCRRPKTWLGRAARSTASSSRGWSKRGSPLRHRPIASRSCGG